MNQTITATRVTVRRSLEPADREPLARILEGTGFFNPEELEVALELVDDRLLNGEASHYRFMVAEDEGRVVGYGCWGPIPGTVRSVDFYWLAVDPGCQGRGVGRALVAETEAWVRESGRDRVYIETSSRAQYVPTRSFYLACGYQIVAELEDFYAPGDGKTMYLKVLSGTSGC